MEEVEYCKRCHRKLKDKKSRELGFGKTCYKKYMSRERHYLFEMNDTIGGIDMLGDTDVINFYQLLNRFSLKSRNIGIIGDEKKYNKILKNIMKIYKNKKNIKVIINENHKFSVIVGDIEYTYILIQNLQDDMFVNTKFRKYM